MLKALKDDALHPCWTEFLLSLQKPKRHRSSDNLKSFKVSLEDPTWKVLPATLKKHRINTEDWQSYAMLIFYGPFGIVLALCFFFCLRINVCYRQSGRAVSEL